MGAEAGQTYEQSGEAGVDATPLQGSFKSGFTLSHAETFSSCSVITPQNADKITSPTVPLGDTPRIR